MITIEVPERNEYLYFAEELAECDGDQFLDFAKLLYWLNFGIISYESFRTLAVYANLRMAWDKKEYQTPGFIPEDDMQKWENVFKLESFIDNFFDKEKDAEGVEQTHLKLNFIKNHNPVYKLVKTYHGPEDAFENVTFGQYMDALDEFIEFTNSGDFKALRKLFAILYLPKGEKYNKTKSRLRAAGIFRTTDVRWLYGCYIFFSAVNKYMLSGSVTVMGEEIDLRIIYIEVEKSKFKSDIPGLGWISTAHDIAESGVFGTYKEVRETPMWGILMRLYELKKKALDDQAKETAEKNKA